MIKISEICYFLKIQPIKELRIKCAEFFPTPTTKAMLHPKSRTLYINNLSPTSNDVEYLFVIAHEARHQWQYDNNIIAHEGYRPSSNLPTKEYNKQWLEIDAHAFAIYYLSLYNVRIYLPNDTIPPDLIEHRVNEIAEYYKEK